MNAPVEPRPIDYLEGLMEGFVAYDAEWRVTYMNAAAERLFSRNRAEVIGRLRHEVFARSTGNAVDRMLRRVKDTRAAERMELYSSNYGRWLEVSASPLADGGIAVYLQDISARKRTEQELRTLAAVVEHTNDFIGLCTPDMVPFYVNEAGRRMVGLVGRDLSRMQVMDFFWPEDRPRIENEAVPALLREGRWSGEVRFRHFETGQTIYTMWNAFAIRDESGKPVAWATISPNLESLKRTEAALQAANEELHENARRKDEFLATLAHELRNPLAPMSNAVEILNLNAPAEVSQAARDVIGRQLRHMVRLIEDLLDVSRITSGKLELRRDRIALSAVIEQALETSRPHLRGHEFTVSLPPRPLWVDADPVRLAQVFSNLLNNACKYTPAGGHIRLSAERDDGRAIIKVRDTGVGIAPEQLPRVFEMFAQVAPAPGRAHDGLGIGLTLSRALVEMHDGEISARSEGPGKGSEFRVTLPMLDEAPRAARVERAVRATGGARRVLVVDDNEDGAASLAMLLRGHGHLVEVAHDGEHALERAAAFKPDVVLLDIGLPGMSGLDACRALRAQPGGGEALIVALSGWGQEEDQRASRGAGFDAHLVKPVAPDALLALLAGH